MDGRTNARTDERGFHGLGYLALNFLDESFLDREGRKKGGKVDVFGCDDGGGDDGSGSANGCFCKAWRVERGVVLQGKVVLGGWGKVKDSFFRFWFWCLERRRRRRKE